MRGEYEEGRKQASIIVSKGGSSGTTFPIWPLSILTNLFGVNRSNWGLCLIPFEIELKLSR